MHTERILSQEIPEELERTPGTENSSATTDHATSLSEKDAVRLFIIRKVIKGLLTQPEAANMLSLSTRQVRRMINRVRKEGDEGIVHKLRGKVSNNAYPDATRNKVISLYRSKYTHLNPVEASQQLMEEDNVTIHSETLRKWLVKSGDWKNNGRRIDNLAVGVHKKSHASTRKRRNEKNSKPAVKRKKKSAVAQEELHQHKELVSPQKRKYIPPPDHPWRRPLYPQYALKPKRTS